MIIALFRAHPLSLQNRGLPHALKKHFLARIPKKREDNWQIEATSFLPHFCVLHQICLPLLNHVTYLYPVFFVRYKKNFVDHALTTIGKGGGG